MTNSPRSVRFPSIAIGSHAEFETYRQTYRSQLDGRYLHEVSLATKEPSLSRPGSCATCLRATVYTSSTAHGEPQADGRVLPNWREQQYCDCADHLSQRARALLHFVQATRSVQPWTRLLLLGRSYAADRRLAEMAQSARQIARMHIETQDDGARRYRLDAADGAFHAVVSSDSLQHVPPLDALLAETCRVLVPGGRFIFTVPFHIMSPETSSQLDDVVRDGALMATDVEAEVHAIGWDIIDRLHEAGFEDAHAHTYWSDELGYLGSFKTIFLAVR